MKKFLTAVAFVITFGIAAQAQSTIVSSRTVDITKGASTTQWILRAGLNMADLAGKDADDAGTKAAYDVALSFQKPLSDFGMFWGMEFGLGSRGYSYDEDDYEESLLSHNVRFSPFTFGYAYNFTDQIKADVRLGGYASFDYTGKFKEKEYDDEEDWNISDCDGYQRFDAGINLGIGVWYNKFNLDFSYQRGFIGVVEDTKWYTNNFMIRLGYAF